MRDNEATGHAQEQVPFGGHIFVNVNEEDEPYQISNTLDLALGMLAEYPNDTVVICYKDSPVGQAMVRDLRA